MRVRDDSYQYSLFVQEATVLTTNETYVALRTGE